MPWGKHRGRPIHEIESGYLVWTLEATDIGEPYRSEIREELADRLGLEPIAISLPAPPPDLAREVADLIITGYRAQARRLHPDHGGDGRAMQKLNDAVSWCRTAGLAR